MNYQVSPDQNTLTIAGVKYMFFEDIVRCALCAFDNEDYTTPECYIAPCVPYMRIDQKEGYFKLKQ